MGGATHVDDLQASNNIPSPLMGGATHVDDLQTSNNIPSPLGGEGQGEGALEKI